MSYKKSRYIYNNENTNGYGTSTPSRGIDTKEINYPDVYEEVNNRQYSVLEEPDMKYKQREHYRSITSGARDTAQPLHYNFYVKFESPYENVVKVEMISSTLPNTAGITNEPYLVYDIDELNCIDFTTNDNNHSGFAVLPIKPSTGAFINPELGCMYHTSYYPKPPVKLSRLTIKIRDVNGDLYDFGFPNGTSDKLYQNSFMLKIVTEEADKSCLNLRNVY